MKRDKNRTLDQIAQDVKKTKKLVREDVYEMLNSFTTRREARQGLIDWIDQNSSMLQKVYPDLTVQQMVVRLTSDIDSYGVNWIDRVMPTVTKPAYRPQYKKNMEVSDKPDPILMKREELLVNQIEKAKRDGQHKLVRDLMDQLIDVQMRQPEIGAKFK